MNELFRHGPPIACFDAADANDDGSVDLADAVFLTNFLLTGGSRPPAPFPDCGAGPECDVEDGVTCDEAQRVCSI